MDSILSQLGNQDEVIVSVDGASDGSEPILLNMEKGLPNSSYKGSR
jgi:glycosyltransferase involved in cell wall biosynthesis